MLLQEAMVFRSAVSNSIVDQWWIDGVCLIQAETKGHRLTIVATVTSVTLFARSWITRDVVVCLLTGYQKSLVFEFVPWCHWMKSEILFLFSAAIVSPLVSLKRRSKSAIYCSGANRCCFRPSCHVVCILLHILSLPYRTPAFVPAWHTSGVGRSLLFP